jgi:hypothetical protein
LTPKVGDTLWLGVAGEDSEPRQFRILAVNADHTVKLEAVESNEDGVHVQLVIRIDQPAVQ